MNIYLVHSVCDYEYGGTEVVAAFTTEEGAQSFINKQGQSYWTHWSDRQYPQYSIEEIEVQDE